MKKNISIIFSSLIVLCSCNNKESNTKNFLSLNNLNGSVKIVKEYSYSAFETFDEIIKEGRDRAIDGEIFIFFDSEKTIDKNGNLIRLINYKEDYIQNEESYEYENDKLVLGKEKHWTNRTIIKNYFYDKNDNLIKIEGRFEGKNSLYSTTIFTYHPNNKIESEKFTVEESLRYIKRFNDKGLLIKKISNLSSSHNDVYPENTFDKTTYEYDQNDNLILIKNFSINDVFVSKTIFTYDNSNNLIIKEEFGKNETKPWSRRTYTYDNKNNVISKKEVFPRYNGESKFYNFSYEYDQNDNWIKCQIRKNHTLTHVVERQIEYY